MTPWASAGCSTSWTQKRNTSAPRMRRGRRPEASSWWVNSARTLGGRGASAGSATTSPVRSVHTCHSCSPWCGVLRRKESTACTSRIRLGLHGLGGTRGVGDEVAGQAHGTGGRLPHPDGLGKRVGRSAQGSVPFWKDCTLRPRESPRFPPPSRCVDLRRRVRSLVLAEGRTPGFRSTARDTRDREQGSPDRSHPGLVVWRVIRRASGRRAWGSAALGDLVGTHDHPEGTTLQPGCSCMARPTGG